jgi:hypothetical protein
MNHRRQNYGMWWAVVAAVVVFGVWSQRHAQSAALAHAVQSKAVALRPTSLPISAGGMTGRLDGLTVITRVDRTTGKLESPDLQATLRLRNTTADQAIRLLSGTVEYVDAAGAVIPLTKDEGSSQFSFYPDHQDGLVPGQETSQVIEVPFPLAALKPNALRDIRLHFTYRATPYRSEIVEGRVTIPG